MTLRLALQLHIRTDLHLLREPQTPYRVRVAAAREVQVLADWLTELELAQAECLNCQATRGGAA